MFLLFDFFSNIKIANSANKNSDKLALTECKKNCFYCKFNAIFTSQNQFLLGWDLRLVVFGADCCCAAA